MVGYKYILSYDCASVADGLLFSGFPNVTPLIAGVLDIFCLVTLTVFRCYKQKWRRLSKKNLCRTYALTVITVICSIDIIYSIVYD